MDFLEYHLPPELIAQQPCQPRDQARLLVLRQPAGSLAHHVFQELPRLLDPGDLLILNNTRVVPARLLGRRATGGKWEGLFLELHNGLWRLLCRGGGRLRPGEIIQVEPGPLRLTLLERREDASWLARPDSPEPPFTLLDRHGQVPLPPYIRKGRADPDDRERYQTIYASPAGAVAAPTAGLHFTPRVFDELQARGISRAFVTLHVGAGTFQPMHEDPEQHRMHAEWGELPGETIAAIRDCQARGGRVVAVGTTTTRLLETAAARGPLAPWQGSTDLFIRPPWRFQAVDALLTNFHLPRSTLLLLVAAFAGSNLLRAAYEAAIAARYRFYSYGDAMLILRAANPLPEAGREPGR